MQRADLARRSGARALVIVEVSRIVVLLACLGGCSAFERPKARMLPAGVSFQGTWDSTWGRLELRQDGKRVSGSFTGFREAA